MPTSRSFPVKVIICLFVAGWDFRAAAAPATLLLEDEFNRGLPGWTAVQPVRGSYLDGPMLWQFDAITGSFSEQSNIYTDSSAGSISRIAVMLINDMTADSNFVYRARLTAGDDDAFGLIWGYENENSFYRVSFARQNRTTIWPFRGWAVDRMEAGRPADLYGGGTTNYVETFVNAANQPFDVTIAMTNNLLTLTVINDPEVAPESFTLVDRQPLPTPAGGKVGFFSWGLAGGNPRSFRIQNPSLVRPGTAVPLAGDLGPILTNWSFLVTPRSDGSTDLNAPGPALWSHGLSINGNRGTMIENSDNFLNADNVAAGTTNFAASSAVAGDVNWSNYLYTARFISSDDDGFGMLLRFKNEMNFYRIAFRAQNSSSGIQRGISIQKNIDLNFSQIFASTSFIPPIGVPIDVHAAIRGNRLQVIAIANPTNAAAQTFFFGPFDITDGTVDQGKIGIFSWAQYSGGTPSDAGTEVDFVRVASLAGEALIVSSPFGAPEPAAGLHDFPVGSLVTAAVNNIITNEPGVRRVLLGWNGSGSVPASGSTNEVAFTLERFSSLSWRWRTEYQLAGTVIGGGRLSGFTQAWIPEGTNIALVAIPNPGNIFVGWSGSSLAVRSNLNLTMNRPYTLTARFALDTDDDALPDDWEQTFFGDLARSAADDPDQDGRNNLAEYQNGTNPAFAEQTVVGDGLAARWENVQRDPALPGDLFVRDFGAGFRGVWENSNNFREAVDPTIIGASNVVDNVSFEGPRIMIRHDSWNEGWSNFTAQAIFSVGDNDGNCVYFRYQDERNWYRVCVVGENNNAAWRAPFGVSVQKRWNGVFTELARNETIATDPADTSFYKRIRVTVSATGPNFEVRVTGWDARATPPDWVTGAEALLTFSDDSLGNGRFGVGTWGQGAMGPGTPEIPIDSGVLIEDVSVSVNNAEVFREDWEQVPLPNQLPPGWTNAVAGTVLPGDWRVSAHRTIAQLSDFGPATSGTAESAKGDADGPVLLAPAHGIADFLLEAGFHPFDDDSIGLVYDFIDRENYARILFTSEASGAGRVPQGLTISRKRGGVWSDIISGETSFVYRPGYPFTATLSNQQGQYRLVAADVDDPTRAQTWQWTDTAASAAGRVGLATWAETDAHFTRLRVQSVSAPAAVGDLRISRVTLSAPGTLLLTVDNPGGRPYDLQQASTLVPADWNTIATGQTGSDVSVNVGSSTRTAFYRLRRGP